MRIFDAHTPNVPANWEDALLWEFNGRNLGPCIPHAHSESEAMLEAIFTLSELASEDAADMA